MLHLNYWQTKLEWKFGTLHLGPTLTYHLPGFYLRTGFLNHHPFMSLLVSILYQCFFSLLTSNSNSDSLYPLFPLFFSLLMFQSLKSINNSINSKRKKERDKELIIKFGSTNNYSGAGRYLTYHIILCLKYYMWGGGRETWTVHKKVAVIIIQHNLTKKWPSMTSWKENKLLHLT